MRRLSDQFAPVIDISAALGIVYGDLGTSPLYTLQAVARTIGGHFSPEAGDPRVGLAFFVGTSSPAISMLANPVFLFFSRLAPEKNREEFLNLDLPGTKLVIGDGPERKRLESCFGMQAKFIGHKRGEELVNWLSICDEMVFPSRTETFGLVMLEALACGIPIAGHDIMGPRDIIHNYVGGI
jgi:glycosyltransferase involved in cell wall biosynthesis